MRNISEIEVLAAGLRLELGEDTISPIDIFSLANNIENLTVVFCNLGENISGMCIKNDITSLIAINSCMSLGRQRFSMAHEFYHLRYDDNKKSVSLMNFDISDEKEKEANIFASHFLLPSIALYNFLGGEKITYKEQVIKLEQQYGLSRKAILKRLIEENKINTDLVIDLQNNVQLSAIKYGYDTELYIPNNKTITTGHYIRLANKLYEEQKISEGKYEELLLDAFRDDIVYGNDVEGELID